MIENIHNFVMPHTFSLLSGAMNTPAARAMLLAIGLQESRFVYRHQVGGPAHGFWQFEMNGGTKEVLTHASSKPHVAGLCRELGYTTRLEVCFTALEHNDTLACGFARLLLWTLPGLLAERGMPERGWRQYTDAWRPGKPHRDTWNANFAKAWTLVAP